MRYGAYVLICAPLLLVSPAVLAADVQPDRSQWPAGSPAVTLSITLPDGRSQEITTHESGLAVVSSGGRQYGFRPTMYDDAGKKMTVTLFDLGNATEPERELASVDVTGGAVASVVGKPAPPFKVKAWKAAMQERSTR